MHQRRYMYYPTGYCKKIKVLSRHLFWGCWDTSDKIMGSSANAKKALVSQHGMIGHLRSPLLARKLCNPFLVAAVRYERVKLT